MEDKSKSIQSLLYHHHNNKNKNRSEIGQNENFQQQILETLENQYIALHNIDETLQQLFTIIMEREKNNFKKEAESKKNIQLNNGDFKINKKRRNKTNKLFYQMIHDSEKNSSSSSESNDIQLYRKKRNNNKNKKFPSCKRIYYFSIRLFFLIIILLIISKMTYNWMHDFSFLSHLQINDNNNNLIKKNTTKRNHIKQKSDVCYINDHKNIISNALIQI